MGEKLGEGYTKLNVPGPGTYDTRKGMEAPSSKFGHG